MQANCLEAEVAQQQGDSEGIIAGGSEYDNCLSLELIEHISKIAVLVLGRDEKVLLHQGLTKGRIQSCTSS